MRTYGGTCKASVQQSHIITQTHTTHLHTTAQTQDQVQRGLLLNVVVGQGAAVFQLLAGKNQTLLVWGDACGKRRIGRRIGLEG